MASVVKVATRNDLKEGMGKRVRVGSKELAVFRVKDQYYAIENACLHRGGPLGDGELHGYAVTCPWHGWKYDVRTGAFTIIPTLKVKTYALKVEGDEIFLEI